MRIIAVSVLSTLALMAYPAAQPATHAVSLPDLLSIRQVTSPRSVARRPLDRLRRARVGKRNRQGQRAQGRAIARLARECRRRRAGAAAHLRRPRRISARLVARRKDHQLSVGAPGRWRPCGSGRYRSAGSDLADARRWRRGVAAHRLKGVDYDVRVVARTARRSPLSRAIRSRRRSTRSISGAMTRPYSKEISACRISGSWTQQRRRPGSARPGRAS